MAETTIGVSRLLTSGANGASAPVNLAPGAKLVEEIVKREKRLEAARQPFLQLSLDGNAAVPADVPLGKQREFALEQGTVVRRQHAGLRRQLPADQHVDRLIEIGPRGLGRPAGRPHQPK